AVLSAAPSLDALDVRLLSAPGDLVQRIRRRVRLARHQVRELGLRPGPRDRRRDPDPRGPGDVQDAERDALTAGRADHLPDADRRAAGPDRRGELHRPDRWGGRLRAAALPIPADGSLW